LINSSFHRGLPRFLDTLPREVFGVLGGLLVLALDVAISGAPAGALARIQAKDVVETIAAIGLSHLTGSWLAWWGRRKERREATAAFAARRRAVSAGLAMLLRAEPEKIKIRIDALHGVLGFERAGRGGCGHRLGRVRAAPVLGRHSRAGPAAR
jgi:hypothetical protein